MSDAPNDVIQRAVTQAMEYDMAMVEAACEDSLQMGVCGVYVQRERCGRVLQAYVSMDVPYGQIHEHLA